MWSRIFENLLAEEQRRETIRLAEYARTVSAICDQAGPWRRTHGLVLRAIGYSHARIDRVVEEKSARTAQMGLLGEFCR
jgi:hypothetical protein